MRTALVVTSAVMLAGCNLMPSVPPRPVTTTGTPEPFPCANFADAHWKEFRIGVDTQDDVIATVGRIWGIEREDIRSPEPDNFHPFPRLSWEVADVGVRYFAEFYEEGPLREIDFDTGSYPTLGQVIECFGAPELYSAYWVQEAETGELNFALWYVDLGLVFSHVSYGRHHRQRPLPPPFPHGLNMHFATMLPLEDVAKMVPTHYKFDYPNKKHYVLCIIKPWAGSIEDLGAEPEKIGSGYYSLPSECNDSTQ